MIKLNAKYCPLLSHKAYSTAHRELTQNTAAPQPASQKEPQQAGILQLQASHSKEEYALIDC
jgi:hypothetical protein